MSLASDELSDRVRAALEPRLAVTEQKMFGGRAFMLPGNMLVAPMKDGSLQVRVGKQAPAEYMTLPGTTQMSMGARTMAGFAQVSGDVLEDDDVLEQWLARARAFVQTLPPK